ncbi:MAG: PAS domain-containing protein [Actinomycetota bacterium]
MRGLEAHGGAGPLGAGAEHLRHAPAVLYICTDEDRCRPLEVSEGCRTVLGYRPEDFDLDLCNRIVHPEDRLAVERRWRDARARRQAYRSIHRLLRADGRTVWVYDQAVPVTDATASGTLWHGVFTDITELREREEAFRESEQRYRSLVEHVPAIVYRAAPDDDRTVLYVSPQIEASLGYSLGEWLDQADIWTELLHPDDREAVLAEMDRCNETGGRFEAEYRLIASDGRAIWFRDVATLVHGEDGAPLYWQGLQLDVTEHHRLEERLLEATFFLEERVKERTAELEEANAFLALEVEDRRAAEAELAVAEERYRSIVHGVPAWLYTWTVVHGVAHGGFASPHASTHFGFDLEEAEAAGESYWHRFVHPDDVSRVFASVARCATEGIPFEEVYRWVRPDGRTFWVIDRTVPWTWDGATRSGEFRGAMMDITDLMEDRLRR